MQYRIKIMGIKTIHTDTENKANQPLVEITADMEGKQFVFSEMISNLAGLSVEELDAAMTQLLTEYAKTIVKASSGIDKVTKKWVGTEKLLNKEYNVDI